MKKKKKSNAAIAQLTPRETLPREKGRGGQVKSDTHAPCAAPASAFTGGLDQSGADAQTDSVELAELIRKISETWRERQDMHRAEKSLTLQIRAVARRLCRGRTCVGETKCALKLCKPCAEQADLLYDEANKLHKLQCSAKIKEVPEFKHPYIVRYDSAVRPFLEARRLLNDRRQGFQDKTRGARMPGFEGALETLALQLPADVVEWVKSVRGVSLLSLAAIVGEAGDLSREGHAPWRGYANPAKLWKRMGLALVNGERQRKCADTEKGTAMGYSPIRRSIVWNIGECMIKAGDKHYRAIYDTRKIYEATKIEKPPILIHRRAKRYMEKRFLLDLWRVWNGMPPKGLGETATELAA